MASKLEYRLQVVRNIAGSAGWPLGMGDGCPGIAAESWAILPWKNTKEPNMAD
jgi:hypothetical protein